MEEDNTGSPFQNNLTNKYRENSSQSPIRQSSKKPLTLAGSASEESNEHIVSARALVIGMSPTEKRNAQNRIQRVERLVNDSC